MWIALTQTVAPGLEEAFRQLIRSRGGELGEIGRRYGLQQMRVFQQGNQGLMVLEVEDAERFGEMTHDPDFQMLGQEMASLMNFQPFREHQFWPEVYCWNDHESRP
ncbi:MAG TPA: hypothetical protein VFB34_01940 [Chloroflexota bacterium]|nr:hypothetical protein [Chloroflexota bacterium]